MCGQGHDLDRAAVAIVLPSEGELIPGQAEQSRIGDGDAMSVAAEIGQYLLGPTKRRLGINHPLHPTQLAEMASESSWAGEAAELPEESKFAGVEGSPQLIEEEPAEEAREHMDRQEEAWSATDPARAVERWATTWYNAMDMRVVMQGLSPSMEDGDEPDLGAEMLWIGGNDA